MNLFTTTPEIPDQLQQTSEGVGSARTLPEYKEYEQSFSKFKPDVKFDNTMYNYGKEAYRTGITQLGVRATQRFFYENISGGETLSPEEADQYFPIKTKREKPISAKLARLEYETHLDESYMAMFSEMALNKPSNYVAMAMGGLVGGIIDPTELAVGIFTGGVAAQTRVGMSLFGVGKAATLAKGAVFGAAESTALEPFYHMISTYNNEQYTWKDTMANLAVGSVLSTGVAGARVLLGDIDVPVRLDPGTIDRLYNSNYERFVHGDTENVGKILAADWNFVREKYKDAIDELSASKEREFVGGATPAQREQVRLEAEREVFKAVNKSAINITTNKNQTPEISTENKEIDLEQQEILDESLSKEKEYDSMLEKEGIEVEKTETETKEPTKKAETKPKEEPAIDEKQAKLQEEEAVSNAFQQTADTFFPNTDVVNINKATDLPKRILDQIDDDFDAFYDVETGKVYFNPASPNVKNKPGAIMLHEIVTHKGLRAIMNDTELTQMISYINKNFAGELDTTRKNIVGGDKLDDATLAEEHLAYGSENGIQAFDYIPYMIERAKQIMGIDPSKSSAMDNAIVREKLYQALKSTSKNRIAQRASSLSQMKDWEREEVFYSVKKVRELDARRENLIKINEGIKKYADEIDAERKMTDAKVRGVKSRIETDKKALKLKEDQRAREIETDKKALKLKEDQRAREIEIQRKATDARIKAYKLKEEQRLNEIKSKRDATDAKTRGMIKGIEDRLKLVPKWQAKSKDFFSTDYEYRGLSELQKLNKDLGIEESVSKALAEHKAKQQELSKAIESEKKAIEDAQFEAERASYSNKTYQKLKDDYVRQEAEIQKIEKEKATLKEIEERAISRAKGKQYKRNKKSQVSDDDLQNSYEDLEDMGLDGRILFRKPTVQEQADAQQFVSGISQIAQSQKQTKINKELGSLSPQEKAVIEDQLSINQDIFSAKIQANINSGMTVEEATKSAINDATRVRAKHNATARLNLYKAANELPIGKRIDFIKDLVERSIPAKVSYDLNRLFGEFDERAKAVTKDYNSKEVWEQVFIAADYYKKNKAGNVNRNTLQPNQIGQQIFDILKNTYSKALEDFRGVGGIHDVLDDYVTSSSWDIDKMAKYHGLSVETFNDKLFRKEADPKTRAVITHKMYESLNDKIDWNAMGMTRGSDKAKRYFKDWIDGLWDRKQSEYTTDKSLGGVSASKYNKQKSRKIQFINGKETFEAQRHFGVEETGASIRDNLQSIITDTELTRTLGPSYAFNTDKVIKAVGESVEQGSRKFQKQVRGALEKVPVSLRLLDGTNRAADITSVVRWMNIVKSLSSIAKLGGLFPNSQSDIAITKDVLSRMEIKGKGIYDTARIYSRISDERQKFTMQQNLATIDGLRGAYASRFDPDHVSASNLLAKTSHIFFTGTLMNFHNRTMREGFQYGAMRRMGIASQYSMDDLINLGDDANNLVEILRSNNISKQEWDAIRSVASETQSNNGRMDYRRAKTDDSILSLDLMEEIEDSEIIALLASKGINNPNPKKIAAERRSLASKYGGMLRDEMDTGVLTPGIREQRILGFGTKIGSWQNMSLGLLTQFKSFPLAMLTKVIIPKYKSMTPVKATASVLATTAQAAIVSVIWSQIKALVEGKTVRPWDDPMLYLDGIARSGGLSFAWDLTTKDYTQYGMSGGLMANAGGPTIGMMSDVAGLGQQTLKDMVSGDFSKSGTRLAKFADSWGGNVPIYDQIKKAYLINGMLDYFSPETNKRKQRFIEEEFGQDFVWGAPTGDNIKVPSFSDYLLRVDKIVDNQ